MQHYYSEIRSYLPLYFPHQENQEFIDYLGQAYLNNIEGETHQFSFISFHMLYMSFIYKTSWFLNKINHPEAVKICAKITDPSSMSFLFDYSLIREKDIMNILRSLKFHKSHIKNFTLPIEYRDNCAHAVGAIHYDNRAIERLVEEEYNYVQTIFLRTHEVLETLITEFYALPNNWNPELRSQPIAYDEVGDFMRDNVLSQKDLEFIACFEPDFLKKESSTSEVIYKKVLFLALQALSYNEREPEENGAIKNAPYLLVGFDDQEEISLEDLIHNEFLYMIRGFSNSDQKAFIEALGNDPVNYGIV
ncbi:MAG: hypothetical protein RLO81_01565 [Fulvivirga sp.]|uniref:hypothetical protein n=1 Tax=Fulvivirga sp. TaxID=1931237 RepID=UPI0032EC904D